MSGYIFLRILTSILNILGGRLLKWYPIVTHQKLASLFELELDKIFLEIIDFIYILNISQPK